MFAMDCMKLCRLFVLYSAFVALVTRCSFAENRALDGYAAKVQNQIIMIGDVARALEPLERQLRQKASGVEYDQQMAIAYESALEALIDRALVLDDFQQRGGSLPDSAVDSRIEEVIRNKFRNDRLALQKELDKEGLTLEEWRADLRAQIIMSLMRDREVISKVSVSPREVRDAYDRDIARYRAPEQVELRMIRVSRGKTSEEREVKRRQMEDVRKRILAGEDFAELAHAVSEGTKADAGGYWGWIEPETRLKELAEAMAILKPGELGEIIETDEDLYLIRIEARREEHVVPFESVRESIQQALRKEQETRLYEEWMQRLKKEAFIKKY